MQCSHLGVGDQVPGGPPVAPKSDTGRLLDFANLQSCESEELL
jgi:hypothetical protein